MATLLVQSCSKSKNEFESKVRAINLYSGYFFKIIKKAIREGKFRSDIDICILSAEHGLIGADAKIEWYDRRMDRQRAEELAADVTNELHKRVVGNYDRVIVNVGKVYKHALKEGLSTLDVDIHHVQGGGIGVKGSNLKDLIRGGTETDSPQTNKATESF
jgi:hypothetical protein